MDAPGANAPRCGALKKRDMPGLPDTGEVGWCV